MKFFERNSSHRLPFLAFLGGIIVTTTSVVLVYVYGATTTIEKIIFTLIAELGFAFVIAAVIIWTVDFRQKTEHLEEVKRNERRFATRNLLSYLTDMDMPVSLSEKLEDYLSESSFIRKNSDFIFEISEREDGLVELTQSMTAEIFNASRHASDYHYLFYVDPPQGLDEEDDRQCGLLYLNLEKKEHAGGSYEKFYSAEYPDEAGWQPINQDQIEISSPSIDPGGWVRTRCVLRSIRRASDAEVFQNLVITEHTRVTIRFDKERFNVEWRCIHPQLVTEKPVDTPEGYSFDADVPLLAGNGFFINWHRKS